MSRRRPLQVIVLGHPLGRSSLEYLRQRGPYRIYQVLFHIPSFDKVYETVDAVFRELHAQGVDLSGNTPTIFQASGSSAGALALAAAWQGLTGNLPEVLNLIRIGHSEYGPSRELPTLDLDQFALEMRADCVKYGCVRVITEDPENAERDAVDDGNQVLGTLPLGSIRNQVRPLRGLMFEKRAQHIAEMIQQTPHLSEAGA